MALQRKLQHSSSTMGKTPPNPSEISASGPSQHWAVETANSEGLNAEQMDYWLTRDSSSGMCKAGFAGDDAPRAVFRKSCSCSRQGIPTYRS